MLKWVFFSCFSRVFCVRQGKKILGKFGGCPWLKQNNQGKEGQGSGAKAKKSPKKSLEKVSRAWEAADPKSEVPESGQERVQKALWTPRAKKASCTGAKWGCTDAKEGLGGARPLLRGPKRVKKTFCTLPY